MYRAQAWILAILITVCWPTHGSAGILNLRSGVGTVVLRDRDTRDSVRYGEVSLEASYSTPNLEWALDIPLRWDVGTGEFDREVWNREGDILRPLRLLRYRSDSDRFSGGLEVLTGWTPGDGYLVRNLTGKGEIDYVLPGIRLRWSDDKLDLDAGMDRPYEPTVQAAALTWKPTGRIALIVEGAADPEAPVILAGVSSGGRPAADSAERLAAQAAGFRLGLVRGDTLDLDVGAHAADINGSARGLGTEVSVSIDFSRYYLNRLRLQIRSVECRGGYVPAWFDAAYPLHRWGPGTQPLLALYPLDDTAPDRTMQIYRIEYDLGDFFRVRAGLEGFEDDSMRRAIFEAQLMEENGRGLELSVWSRSDGPDAKLFSEESNLHSRVNALYNFLPHFLLNLSFHHSWVYSDEGPGFFPLNSIVVGVMYDISL